MNRDEIATYLWNSDDQSYGFSIRMTLPEPVTDVEPTSRQLIAIKDFYQCEYPALTFDQASALLAYREYARLCGDVIFKQAPLNTIPVLKACLAAYIGSDAEIAKWVVNWSNRNFCRGSSSTRVKGSPFFADLESFGKHLLKSMERRPKEIERENLQRLLKIKL